MRSSLVAGSLELDLLWDGVPAAEAAHRDDSAFVPSTAAAWRLNAMRPCQEPTGWRGFTLGKARHLILNSLYNRSAVESCSGPLHHSGTIRIDSLSSRFKLACCGAFLQSG